MSHVDSTDEAIEKILNPHRNANDSKESDNSKPKKETPKNDANNIYEYSDDTEQDDTDW